MSDTTGPVLVYSSACPVCDHAGSWIERLDRVDALDYAHLETPEGRQLVTDCHDDDYIHAPHLIGGDWYIYGKWPVGAAVSIILAWTQLMAIWRRLTGARAASRTARTNP